MSLEPIATRVPVERGPSWLASLLARCRWIQGTPKITSLALKSVALLLVVASSQPLTHAQAQAAPAQTIWRLLDYIAVDYPGAADNGTIIDEGEYREMKEFSATVAKLIAELPSTPHKARLSQGATEVERKIAEKVSGSIVAAAARQLAADLIKTYPIPLAPNAPPDFGRGKALYAHHCAACHGATGHGDGQAAAKLDPPPIDFTDLARARERSVLALYQVIEQGLDGTSMAGFGHLPPQDRWALAFYVGSFAYPESDAAEGKRLWQRDDSLHGRLDLKGLVGTTPAGFAGDFGEENGPKLVAYLRRHPDATARTSPPGALALARTRLNAALTAYERGDSKVAADLALSSYLDGVEPVEAILSARRHELMVGIEGAMVDLRAAIAQGESFASVKDRAAVVSALLADAEKVLVPKQASTISSFAAALTILLREGLEALLIVMALLGFLAKADRRDVVLYVHGGWVSALVAGGATWMAATRLITISGASRELTEGLGGVLAAAVLVWVGIWMHGKSHADAWQKYVREKLGRALNRRSAWFLFALSFVVVYREVFETILFYAAIWSDGNGGAVIAGALAAVVTLACVAVAMVRFSRKLPIGKFFAHTATLLSVLAVVLIGKGVAGLHEAGYLPITPWRWFPRVELLGVYPTRETLLAQLAVIALLVLGFQWNRRLEERPA